MGSISFVKNDIPARFGSSIIRILVLVIASAAVPIILYVDIHVLCYNHGSGEIMR